MKRPSIPILVGLIACGMGYVAYSHFISNQNAQEIILSGNVDIRQVNLGFRVPGKLDKLSVDEGDSVKAGDVIAQLDKQPNKDDVDANKAAVEQAEANLLEQQALFDNADILLTRQKGLVANGSISKQDLDDASAQKKKAEAKLKSAEAALAQAKSKLAISLTNLGDTDLVAPEDGIVLTRVHEKGTVLAAGTTVFTVSLVNPVWIRSYVSETDLGHVKEGMPVSITTDARPHKPIVGQIGFISPTAEFTPKNVETRELRTDLVYRIRVIAQDKEGRLRQGMPVTISIDTGD